MKLLRNLNRVKQNCWNLRSCDYFPYDRTISQIICKTAGKYKKQTRNAYKQFREDPYHPSLHFKKVHQEKPVYSARISDNYRTVGAKKGNTLIWFWIGPHSEYERLLYRL